MILVVSLYDFVGGPLFAENHIQHLVHKYSGKWSRQRVRTRVTQFHPQDRSGLICYLV
jgi:hypothetical protein